MTVQRRLQNWRFTIEISVNGRKKKASGPAAIEV
jgi:hypothetical protein